MKRFLTFLLGIGILLTTANAAPTDNGEVMSAKSIMDKELQTQAKMKAAKSQNVTEGNFILEESPKMKLTVSEDAKLIAPTKTKARKVSGKVAGKVSAADLKGNFVGTYLTLSDNSFDGGSTVQIVPDAQGDSITIKYFWNGQNVRAHINSETNEVTIPRQQVMANVQIADGVYSNLDIATITTAGKPDYTAPITGKVTANGLDFSEAWWAVFVQAAGTYKDRFVGAYYNTTVQRATGTMVYQKKNTAGAYVDYGYYVLADQTKENVLTVTNLFNAGLEVNFLLNRDRTAEISSQPAFINSAGTYLTIKCLSFNDAGNLTGYNPIIITDKAAETNNTEITWTDWSLLCAAASSYAGRLENTKLTAYTPISYPVLSETSFEGDGTEANPYLIKNRDHLILLADQVNNNTTETNGMSYSNPIYSLYQGKYFALANDIDLNNYRLDPIGGSTLVRFGGNFDGRGHTLKNVYVEGGSKYQAGIFGVCDTTSVIKNLNVENLNVNSDYYYAGGVYAVNCGTTENIHVVNPTITSARSMGAAIGGIALGSVKNCSVLNGTVLAPSWVGGAFGETHGGISDVSVFGTKVYMNGGGSPAGGVVSNLIGDGTRLSFAGTVMYYQYSEQQFLGGICGMLQSGTLSKSFSGGLVRGYSNDNYIGGLVGWARGNVEDCYTSGVVQCYSRKNGGLIGVLGSNVTITKPVVRNCYTSALTICETYQYDRNNCNEVIGLITEGVDVTLENIYANRQITNFYSTRFASNTAELTAAAGPKGFSADNWVFTEGAYPRVKGLENTPAAQYTASAVDFSAIDNVKKLSNNTPLTALGDTKFFFLVGDSLTTQGHYAKIVDNKMIEISENFGIDTLYMVNGKAQTFMFLAIAPIPFEGEGSEISPFLIKTKGDLVALSHATTLKDQTFPGIYFKQTNDIDMELTEDFEVICGKSSDAYNKFEGVYDGGGYTIDRLTVPNCIPTWTKPIQPGQLGTINTAGTRGITGLFGRLGENGIVRNVTIGAGSKLTEMWAQCGAVVGNSSGLIENCRNYADVHGYSCWVGGIVGLTNKGSITRNCYNAGRVTSCYANAGGIVGSLTQSTVENCVNTGDIEIVLMVTNFSTNRNRVGGITGNTSTGGVYKNNVNFGTIKSLAGYAGGIAPGVDSSASGVAVMSNCMNFGNVYAADKATLGGIAGTAVTDSVTTTYYDIQNIGLLAAANAEHEGMFGVTTEFLTSGKAIEGFDAELWDFTAGVYPTLKEYANEEKVKAARKVYAQMDEKFTVGNFLTTATLSDGATWSLVKGETFKIEGNKLIGPASVEEVVTDTLKAVNAAGVLRPILLTALPQFTLSGEGTQAKPYIINNVDDWNTLCSFVDKVGEDFEGQFFAVKGDIDFNGIATPARLGANGVTGFAGILDGENHTIKNCALKSIATQSCALIGVMKEGSVVKNLTFEGTVSGTHSYATSFVDKLYGTLENIESKAVITTTSTTSAGVAGYAYDGAVFDKVKFSGSLTSSNTGMAGIVNVTISAGHVTFKDCAFTGKLINTKTSTATTAQVMTIGGLVATCGSADFTNCYSDGEITLANETVTSTIGGLVANATGNKDYPEYTFTNCYNATPITAGVKVAGLVGGVTTTAANGVYKFTDCYNVADIATKSTKALSGPTAGIVVNYTPGSSFIRCHNEGTILSNYNVYAAGIAGSNTGTPGSTATPDSVVFIDCWNEGMIIADGNQGGGVVGYVSGKVHLINCYNTGDVSATSTAAATTGTMAGGICSAFAGAGPQMINCYNTGNITTRHGRAGGLISWGAPTNSLVKGCWNSGTVMSTDTVSGTSNSNGAWAIGGIAASSGANFEDCYNTGAIKGMARVGGIVGEPSKSTTYATTIKNSYNTGTITAMADSCGYIVGVNTDANGKIWSTANSVENCYYLDNSTGTLAQPEGAKAITVAELVGKKISDGYAIVDNYSFPVVAGFEKNEVAVFNAAQLIPAKDNTLDKITEGFNVGGSPIVNWTSDCAKLSFSGTDATFTGSYTGKVKVTATAGELTKSYDLTVDAKSGVNDLNADAEIVSVRYFNAAGMEVAKPTAADGQVYVTVTKYIDGTERVAKLLNK